MRYEKSLSSSLSLREMTNCNPVTYLTASKGYKFSIKRHSKFEQNVFRDGWKM